MACEVAAFLKQLPGAVDVALVNSEQWTEYHRSIMEALVEGVRVFLDVFLAFGCIHAQICDKTIDCLH